MSDATPDPDATARLLRGRLASGPLSLPVSGSSMRGSIDSGSVVEIHAARAPRVGEIWAFTDDSGNLVVHRVRHLRGDTVIARGSGNTLDDEPVEHQRLIGRVISATAGARTRRYGTLDRRRAAIEFSTRSVVRRLRRSVLRR